MHCTLQIKNLKFEKNFTKENFYKDLRKFKKENFFLIDKKIITKI